MEVKYTENGVTVTGLSNISLAETLDCGQAFRWKPNDEGLWCGVVRGIYRKVRQEEDGMTVLGADKEEFDSVWYDYFDLGRDYDKLKAEFAENQLIADACKFGPGIRVLRQEPWEAPALSLCRP